MVNKDQKTVDNIRNTNTDLVNYQNSFSSNDQLFQTCEKCWKIAQDEKNTLNDSGNVFCHLE